MAFSFRCFAPILLVLVFGLFEKVPTFKAVVEDPLLAVFEKWVGDYG
jgi:hypothetical protein